MPDPANLPEFNALEHAYPTWSIGIEGATHGRELIVAILPNFEPLRPPWCKVDCSREKAEVAIGFCTRTPSSAARVGSALIAARWRTGSVAPIRMQQLAESVGIYKAKSLLEFQRLGLALQAAAKMAAGETPIDWKLWARLNDQGHREMYERESAWHRKARELLGEERYRTEVLGLEPKAAAHG